MSPGKVVEVFYNVSKEKFEKEISIKRQPAVLRGVDIGECGTKWTAEYLASVGGKREVKIHVCPTHQMDFINKNFAYKSLPFNEFIRRAAAVEDLEKFFISKDEKYYLRSLGDDPRKDISDIRVNFPELAGDINIPNFFEDSAFFSSVFRIGSKGMQLWTHYDIMDNMLIQVNGRKRVVLYSPKDAVYLYLNGDKSEVLDVDDPDLTKYPKFAKTTRYECELEPGDILFIPAMWFHNVISLDFGVAVNVFWRHLEENFYDHKDTYGNKDLVLATRAMQVLDRALKILDEMPREYKDFYARRMVVRIQNKAFTQDS